MCLNSQNDQVIDNCLINKIRVSQRDWWKVMSLAGWRILTISCLKGIQTFPAGKKSVQVLEDSLHLVGDI